ncbi:hypothetical protein ILUMI_03258 [Ignelater luminosus]|uniref:Uncharacterized protein n=1 Tax=Ignelater luminosus TaxID=2038154 RepID=A0A8K0DGW3_IGNLU|nr:hypothetical protein ILUMI_03258 [Ignelater luminosus]
MNELASILLTFVGSMLAVVLACVCIMACCQILVENNKNETQSVRLHSNHTLQTSSPLLRHNQEIETDVISSRNSQVASMHQPKPPPIELNSMNGRDCFEINNLNIYRRGNPPYATTTSSSMPLPSTSQDLYLEYNLNDIHVHDLTALSSVPSTSRSFHHVINSNLEDLPPPSYAEAVLNKSGRQ